MFSFAWKENLGSSIFEVWNKNNFGFADEIFFLQFRQMKVSSYTGGVWYKSV